MIAKPELESENLAFARKSAQRIISEAPSRLPCSDGESRALNLMRAIVEPYCDEVHEEPFGAHPASSAVLYKAVCIMFILGAVLLKLSEIFGTVAFAAVAAPLSLAAFAVFAYKFFFDGKLFDAIFPKQTALNILLKRFSRSTTLTRVVITADIGTKTRRRKFKNAALTVRMLTVCSILCNTFVFCVCNAYLICGAPENSTVFAVLSSLGVLMTVFYILLFFVSDFKKADSDFDGSAYVCAVCAAVMRQLSQNGTRFSNTEFCLLLTSCGSASHAGAYAFSQKHRRIFRDVPTVFIAPEALCFSNELAVCFNENEKNSGEAASVTADAAESIGIKAKKQLPAFGTPAHTPFSADGFCACSFGTAEKHVGIPDEEITGKAISDTAYILTQTLNYYDNLQN